MHVDDDDMKHVPDDVSQQFEPPEGAAGQLFAQSLSCLHDGAHAVPPPEELPPLEPLDE